MGKAVRRRTVLSVAIAAPMIIGRRASAADSGRSPSASTPASRATSCASRSFRHSRRSTQCKVYTTQGVTLEQIALMRATRNNPKYRVMFVDDIGVELAKREGLIERLPREQIPNMERVLKRLYLLRRLRCRAFAMSAAGSCYNTATGKPLTSYGDLVGSAACATAS